MPDGQRSVTQPSPERPLHIPSPLTDSEARTGGALESDHQRREASQRVETQEGNKGLLGILDKLVHKTKPELVLDDAIRQAEDEKRAKWDAMDKTPLSNGGPDAGRGGQAQRRADADTGAYAYRGPDGPKHVNTDMSPIKPAMAETPQSTVNTGELEQLAAAQAELAAKKAEAVMREPGERKGQPTPGAPKPAETPGTISDMEAKAQRVAEINKQQAELKAKQAEEARLKAEAEVAAQAAQALIQEETAQEAPAEQQAPAVELPVGEAAEKLRRQALTEVHALMDIGRQMGKRADDYVAGLAGAESKIRGVSAETFNAKDSVDRATHESAIRLNAALSGGLKQMSADSRTVLEADHSLELRTLENDLSRLAQSTDAAERRAIAKRAVSTYSRLSGEMKRASGRQMATSENLVRSTQESASNQTQTLADIQADREQQAARTGGEATPLSAAATTLKTEAQNTAVMTHNYDQQFRQHNVTSLSEMNLREDNFLKTLQEMAGGELEAAPAPGLEGAPAVAHADQVEAAISGAAPVTPDTDPAAIAEQVAAELKVETATPPATAEVAAPANESKESSENAELKKQVAELAAQVSAMQELILKMKAKEEGVDETTFLDLLSRNKGKIAAVIAALIIGMPLKTAMSEMARNKAGMAVGLGAR